MAKSSHWYDPIKKFFSKAWVKIVAVLAVVATGAFFLIKYFKLFNLFSSNKAKSQVVNAPSIDKPSSDTEKGKETQVKKDIQETDKVSKEPPESHSGESLDNSISEWNKDQ